jgi:hypothetical protein
MASGRLNIPHSSGYQCHGARASRPREANEVKFRRCVTHSLIELSAVNEVRRKPDTPVWKLEASLRCHCSEALRGRDSSRLEQAQCR